MELQSPRMWYSKFGKEGLNWGPEFAVIQTIHVDREKKALFATAGTKLRRGDKSPLDGSFQYVAHPTSIDGMLQTAFIATTAGCVGALRATVPVSMDSIRISCNALKDSFSESNWNYDATATKIGFRTFSIDAELRSSSNDILMRMNKLLARVVWKPDISAPQLKEYQQIQKYFDWYISGLEQDVSEGERLTGALLDLAAHKYPNRDILHVGQNPDFIKAAKRILSVDSSLRRCASFHTGTFDSTGSLRIIDQLDELSKMAYPRSDQTFNLVLSEIDIDATAHPCLASSALIIRIGGASRNTSTEAKWIWRTAAPMALHQSQNSAMVLIVSRSRNASPVERSIISQLADQLCLSASIMNIDEASSSNISARSIVICTLELQDPFLVHMSGSEAAALKVITDNAATVVWLTHAGILKGKNPDFTPVLGLSRAVMLEQPSLRFSVLDVEDPKHSPLQTARNVSFILSQLLHESDPDLEYVESEGVMHVSRWEPEEQLNDTFMSKQADRTVEMALKDTGNCSLQIQRPGQFDTIYFKANEFRDVLPDDYVEIDVKSVGLNAKDLYVLGGKVDTKNVTCSCECAGVLISRGTKVQGLEVGDRVVCLAPGHFATRERVPYWSVCKLQDAERFTIASSIPVVFSTALYALKYKASLQPGETILIHSAAGGVGIAAIQLARHLRADIYCTVGSEAKKAFLVESFGIPADHIFNSRDFSFLPAILHATSGQGVDVVLNSLTGELLHNSVDACAEFGRFVEIGKRDILDHGSRDMISFARNISFMAFDLADIFYSKRQSHHRLWHNLLGESMNLIRTGMAKPCSPLRVFEAGYVADAYKYFALGTRTGKVAVSFEDDTNMINMLPSPYQTQFHGKKTYLMVGCLGGLGRSILKWMFTRGARSFVFLGRSGTDKPVAKDLVDDLKKAGARFEIVRGDVSNYHDVEKAVESADSPLGGVVQAAMGLHEALWTAMSNDAWNASIRPKIDGTWNLHNALRHQKRDSELDFFLMTSSISGTVGTATESNYCAANAFLDAFARYRNAQGLLGVSVGLGMISEVGYLHEHPDIEKLLKRKGIHSINEDELLQIIDLAIANQNLDMWQPRYDSLSNAHLLTGIEFIGLQEQRDQGFEGDNHVLADPRASLYSAAFAREGSSSALQTSLTKRQFPEEIVKALKDRTSDSLFEAVSAVISKKISNLILLPLKKLRLDKMLGEFGLDSMLAAEFRTFVYHTLEVDVPFMTLLDKGATVNDIARLISEQIEAKSEK
ncbi:KR domain-containing protein [Massariosphaeria phaeospora]|uniref:KR domain-containing protein n=1 Tax=Massariosphaeria phaeospora TaxID=100035 RepID=A0A7C8IQ13_9PLEO|nr:KR domain-containing protein [Massariosphaeria phaeospora]